MFVPTQSPVSSQQPDKKSASLPCQSPSQQQECTSFTSPLQLSVNTDSCNPCNPHLKSPERVEEDSQATQIEEFTDPPAVDTGDSVTSRPNQNNENNAVSSESQTTTSSKPLPSAETLKQQSEGSRTQPSNQNSDQHKKSETRLNEQNMNVKEAKSSNSPSSDLTANSCVPETPSDNTPCSLPSKPGLSQAAESSRGETARSRPTGQQQEAVSGSPTLKDGRDECEQGDVEEEEVMEQESTDGALGIALVLSQSQLVSPEPMEEEDSQDLNQNSVIIVADSEKDVPPQTKSDHSQPIRGKLSVSANGHKSQPEEQEADAAADGLSQVENVEQEPEGVKDKSMSESSGGKQCVHSVQCLVFKELKACSVR